MTGGLAGLRHRIGARVTWLVPPWRRRVLARELKVDHFQPLSQQADGCWPGNSRWITSSRSASRPAGTKPAWKSHCQFCGAYIEQSLDGWVAPARLFPHGPCPASPDGIHHEQEEIPHGQPEI